MEKIQNKPLKTINKIEDKKAQQNTSGATLGNISSLNPMISNQNIKSNNISISESKKGNKSPLPNINIPSGKKILPPIGDKSTSRIQITDQQPMYNDSQEEIKLDEINDMMKQLIDDF